MEMSLFSAQPFVYMPMPRLDVHLRFTFSLCILDVHLRFTFSLCNSLSLLDVHLRFTFAPGSIWEIKIAISMFRVVLSMPSKEQQAECNLWSLAWPQWEVVAAVVPMAESTALWRTSSI